MNLSTSLLILGVISSPVLAMDGDLTQGLTDPGARSVVTDRESFLRGSYELVVKDCKGQIEAGAYDACVEALRSLEDSLSKAQSTEMQEKTRLVKLRIKLVEAHKQAAALGEEHPDQYFKTLFPAYTALPEAHFPYDEVLPFWNRYLRDDAGRSRFNRYRKVRIIARAKDDTDLEERFMRGAQKRLVDYGFLYLDPTTSQSNPDVLLKLQMKGEEVLNPLDPSKQHKKTYRLVLDVQSFKLVTGGVSLGSRQLEPEETAETLDEARDQAAGQSALKLIDGMFYHTLCALFPPAG